MTKSVDQILDDGAKGLLYFEQLLPLYQEAFGTDLGWPLLKIQAAYDQERGMDLAKLQASADALKAMITTADTRRGEQQAAANGLGASWQGEAAEAGIGRLREIVGLAEQDRNLAQTLATAMSDAVPALQKIVEDKATTVERIAAGHLVAVGSQQTLITVEGMSVIDIQQIIRSSKSGEILDSLLNRLTEVRGIENRTDDVERRSEDWKQAVRATCQEWLDEVFKQGYSDKLGIFTEQCMVTQTSIEAKYTVIQAAADAIEERTYPSVAGAAGAPADQPSKGDQSGDNGNQNSNGNQNANGNQNSSGGQNTSDGGQTTSAGTRDGDTTSPVKTTTQDTDDDTDDDDTDDDSDASTALSNLATTLSELGTTVSSALTGDLGDSLTSAAESVGTAITDGIEQLTEQASSLLTGEHEASFQIGDTEVSLQAGENGLSLTTTDATGAITEYRLTLDENGIPVIEQESSAADTVTPTEDEGAGVLGSGTPQSGTGQGSGGSADTADGAAPETPDPLAPPAAAENGSGEPDSDSGTGGVPVTPRATRQETDGEHTPTVEDHQANDAGDSGAVLAEAGPL